MSAPLFLVAAGLLTEPGGTVLLDGPEGHHAADVQRLSVGEQVLLADGVGTLATCAVTATAKGELTLVIHQLEHLPPPQPRFVLVQALAKGDRDLQAIEAATELDVDEVVPWQADRSIVRWRAERAERARRKWEHTVLAATKQARRARIPLVGPLASRADLRQRVTRAELALILHEEAQLPLAQVDLPSQGEVILIVGPEGGISPEEMQVLQKGGAIPVRLGRTVLRTSTAGPAALALLNARSRWR